MMLDQGGEALDPVPVVAVEDAIDRADFCIMDMSADHAVDPAPAGFSGDRSLEVADVADRPLDL